MRLATRSTMGVSRKPSQHLISSLSVLLFVFIALLCLCPPAVRAEGEHPEYGTVIGIGEQSSPRELAFYSYGLSADLGTTYVKFLAFSEANLTCKKSAIHASGNVLLGMTVCSDKAYSVTQGGRVEIIANDQGHRITPSWVSFNDEERL